MKKLLSLILGVSFLAIQTGCAAFAETYSALPANTPVIIKATDSYNSATLKAGDNISFRVVDNITVNEDVVIPSETPVYAVVKKAKARSRIGKSGEIIIEDFYTTSINGEKIPLSGTISEKAKSKMKLSIVLSAVIIPFFLLMHGKNAQIDQGTQYTVYTSSSVEF